MDFKAIEVICATVSTLMEEMEWVDYGDPGMHTPLIQSHDDYHKLDMLIDFLGTLTRSMDCRVPFVTSEGKIIREWIQTVLEMGTRYKRAMEGLDRSK